MARPANKPAASSKRRSSLQKMMDILDLFEQGEGRWTPERMGEQLGVPRSTLYRYLKVLSEAGLVTSLPDIGYTVGPRVAELDYGMRSSDPLIVDGRPLLQALLSEVPGVGLICRHYRGHVLCVHQEGAAAEFRSSYERGRAMPLARGAASRAILAYLRPAQLRVLWERENAQFTQPGGPRSLQELQAGLALVRREGCCVSRGEVTQGVVGVAAPVFDGEGAIIGSLSVTLWDAGISERRLRAVTDRVVFSARVLSNSMRRQIAP